MELEFSFYNSPSGKKQGLTFSDVPLLPEIFRWNDTKSRVPFTFKQNFPETFCKC